MYPFASWLFPPFHNGFSGPFLFRLFMFICYAIAQCMSIVRLGRALRRLYAQFSYALFVVQSHLALGPLPALKEGGEFGMLLDEKIRVAARKAIV